VDAVADTGKPHRVFMGGIEMRKFAVGFMITVAFVVGLKPVNALSETDGTPGTISAEQFDKMISGLEGLLRGREGVKLSPADRKGLEEMLKEARRMRSEIPPGGVFKLPTPAESIAKIEAFKRTPEYARLSQQEKDELEVNLRNLRNTHRHEENERPVAASHKKIGKASSKAVSPVTPLNETNRWIFVPKKSGR